MNFITSLFTDISIQTKKGFEEAKKPENYSHSELNPLPGVFAMRLGIVNTKDNRSLKFSVFYDQTNKNGAKMEEYQKEVDLCRARIIEELMEHLENWLVDGDVLEITSKITYMGDEATIFNVEASNF